MEPDESPLGPLGSAFDAAEVQPSTASRLVLYAADRQDGGGGLDDPFTSGQAGERLHAGALGDMGKSTRVGGEDDQGPIVNVTREYPLDYAIVMFGYLLPFVLIITIVTNLLVVAVLYQRHMRTPTNIVLFTMAIVDLCTLLSPSPWYLYIYTFGNHDKYLYPPSLCYTHHVMTDVIPVFFHTSSIWLALLLASQRYIYVCHPTLARTWCTIPRVKWAIFCILTIAFAHQIPRFFDNTFTTTVIMHNDRQVHACRFNIAKWVEAIQVPLYYTTYFTFRIFFVFIIPCFALITLNLLLFRALKQAENKRCQLLKTKFKLATETEGPSEARPTTNNNHLFHQHNHRPNHLRHAQTSGYLTGAGSGPASGGGNGSAPVGPAAGGATAASALAAGGTIHEGRPAGVGVAASNGQSTPPSDNTTGQVSPLDASDLKPPSQQRSAGQRQGAPCEPPSSCRTASGQDVRTSKQVVGAAGEHEKSASEAHTGPASLELGRSSRSSAASRSGPTSSAGSSRTSRSSASDSKAGEDFESTCAECAAAYAREHRGSEPCARCSAAAVAAAASAQGGGSSSPPPLGGATSCEHRPGSYHRHGLQHQPVSQCSSILGGATNTTTNDDDDDDEDISSSCPATQNISGSLLASRANASASGGGPGKTEDAAAAAADEAAEQTDDAANEEELSVNCDDEDDDEPSGGECASGREPAAAPLAPRRVPKSGSVDSRLACGCLTARASALRRVRLLGRAKQREAQAEGRAYAAVFECPHNELGPSTARVIEILDGARGATCAVSEPCIKCRQGSSGPGRPPTERAPDREGCAAPSGDVARPKRNSAGGLLVGLTDRSPEAKQPEGPLEAKQVVEAREQVVAVRASPQLGRPRQQRAASQCPAPSLAATSFLLAGGNGPSANQATTTTTLLSAHTNSIGSLLRVGGNHRQQANQQQQQLHLSACSSATVTSVPPYHQRLKSPSFASCTTGRGSRATLLGSTAMPLIVSGGPASGSQQLGGSQQVGGGSSRGGGGGPDFQAPLSSSSRMMDSNRTTLMLVVVVTVFLIVEVPVALASIAHVVLNLFDAFRDVELSSYLDYIKLFTNFFIMISYSVNFTIYCSMSKKFRETFRNLFFCSRSAEQKRRAKRMLYQQSQVQHSQYEPFTQSQQHHHQMAPHHQHAFTNSYHHVRASSVATTNNLMSSRLLRPLGGGGAGGHAFNDRASYDFSLAKTPDELDSQQRPRPKLNPNGRHEQPRRECEV